MDKHYYSITSLIAYLKPVWNNSKNGSEPVWYYLLLRVAGIILLFIFLDKVLTKITRLPDIAYFEPVIALELLKRWFTTWYVYILVPSILFAALFYKRWWVSWESFDFGKGIRILCTLATVVLAWVFSTYDFNLYFNENHYFDRILLLVLAVLVYWRPVFIFPFLLFLVPVISQFTVLVGFSWAAPFLPIMLLILFSSFFIVYVLTKTFLSNDFVFLAGCLFASYYWASGWGKMNWDWICYDQIYYLLPATYANGWLAGLDAETIATITKGMSWLNMPLKLFVLIAEVACLLFFLKRNFAKWFLGSWIVMHLGIFLTSGICFWMWMLLDAGLLLLFIKKEWFGEVPVFNTTRFAISVVLIAGGSFWCNPVQLAWYDSPASYTYRFEAHTQSGKTYELPPGFFAPYDYQFTLGSFSYLCKEPVLPLTWGSTGEPKLAQWLMEADSPESILQYEKSKGKIRFNESRTIALDDFMQRYIRNWNERYAKNTLFSYLRAPRLLWTFPEYPSIETPDSIKKIAVNQIFSYFDGDQYLEIRQKTIHSIEISNK